MALKSIKNYFYNISKQPIPMKYSVFLNSLGSKPYKHFVINKELGLKAYDEKNCYLINFGPYDKELFDLLIQYGPVDFEGPWNYRSYSNEILIIFIYVQLGIILMKNL